MHTMAACMHAERLRRDVICAVGVEVAFFALAALELRRSGSS